MKEPIPLDDFAKRRAGRGAPVEKSRSSVRPAAGAAAIVFGPFHLDLAAFELRRDGDPVKLALQPARVLALLVGRKGEVVSRDELRRALWGDMLVDFEHGLNNCMRQIRAALGDDADQPRFIETLPKRGYRFVAPVEVVEERDTAAPSGPARPIEEGLRLASVGKPRVGSRRSKRFWILLFGGIFAVAALAAVRLLHHWPALAFQSRDFVLVADFENSTGDPRFDQALNIAFTVSLEQSKYANVFPRLRLDAVLRRMGKSANQPITSALGREICERENIRGLIAGAITRVGHEYRLTSELIDPHSGLAVRSYVTRASGEDRVLDALDGLAARLRADLGESLFQIYRDNRRLPEVTTPSLNALREYADGQSLWQSGKLNEAIPHWRAATALDAGFVMAHVASATCGARCETGSSRQNTLAGAGEIGAWRSQNTAPREKTALRRIKTWRLVIC